MLRWICGLAVAIVLLPVPSQAVTEQYLPDSAQVRYVGANRWEITVSWTNDTGKKLYDCAFELEVKPKPGAAVRIETANPVVIGKLKPRRSASGKWVVVAPENQGLYYRVKVKYSPGDRPR